MKTELRFSKLKKKYKPLQEKKKTTLYTYKTLPGIVIFPKCCELKVVFHSTATAVSPAVSPECYLIQEAFHAEVWPFKGIHIVCYPFLCFIMYMLMSWGWWPGDKLLVSDKLLDNLLISWKPCKWRREERTVKIKDCLWKLVRGPVEKD